MLSSSDKHYIHQTIKTRLDEAIDVQDERSKQRDLQLGEKIEDLRNDMAGEFLRNRQEHAEIRQEIGDFKNKTLNMLDQILGELKAMRENYTICSYHREINTSAVARLDNRLARVETQLSLEDTDSE